MEWLRHDLEGAASGLWPDDNFADTGFAPGSRQFARRGRQMGFRIALVEIRADWPGYSLPMGFRLATHKTCGCPVCHITRDEMPDLNNITADDGPWDDFDDDSYQALVDRCLVKVIILTEEDRLAIKRSPLVFDGKQLSDNGRGGRMLTTAVTLPSGPPGIPGYTHQLLAGDRLHPSHRLHNVTDFEDAAKVATPFECMFWRFDVLPKDARLVHHAPLMRIPGVGMHTWAIDVLHTWLIGGLARLIAAMIWFILDSDCFNVKYPWMNQEEGYEMAVMRLRNLLREHYRAMRRSDPTWDARASQVWSLTVSMLGNKSGPMMSTKADETKHLLTFVVEIFRTYQVQLTAFSATRFKFLLASAESEQEVNRIIKTSGRVLSDTQRQSLMDAYLRHLSMWFRSGGACYPKHHLMLHCIQRTRILGNPRFYHTFRDESLNGVVVKLARSCHRTTFMDSVHERYQWLEALDLCTHMF